ncbi:MAG: tripartite tricarboxylate transporter TctB family protein [Synergistaceae bacterium]|nr:tripartite tricarboxylate transporter TctB family protein [Synergistaceae bacterium]
MAKSNKIAGLILLVFFGYALYMALSFPLRSSYFPIIICSLGIFLSLLLIIRAFISEARGTDKAAEPLTPKARKMIAVMGALILLYAAGINVLGFASSSFLYIVITGVILYPGQLSLKPVSIIIISALVLSLAITIIFKQVLYVPLPSGLLF